MYLPYLRGKQFELIALRELSEFMHSHKDKVSPIIEPVKKISSTLKKTISELIKEDINFTLIVNPRVGGLSNPVEQILGLIEDYPELKNYQIGIIIDEYTSFENIKPSFEDYKKLSPNGVTLIHNAVIPDIQSEVESLEKFIPVKFNVVNYNKTRGSRRYFRNFSTETRVSLDDYFESESKNSDYHGKSSVFTDEHLYFKEEGFKGFSDFLTIGDNYSDSGFMPYAVAIHISYLDESDNKIKVQHFVSDSNGDTSDVAGKFSEANEKLVRWCSANGHDTIAIQAFNKLYDEGHFPGLGSIKKLSVQNHIEVVLKSF